MCLGIPARVVSVDDSDRVSRPALLRRADGVEMDADLALIPEAKTGDFVIAHSGYGVSIVTAEQARETADMLDQITRGGI